MCRVKSSSSSHLGEPEQLILNESFTCKDDDMKPVIWKRSRILKILLACVIIILMGFIYGYNISEQLLSTIQGERKELPWLSEGILGNFEPVETPPDDGPGEGGKPYNVPAGKETEIQKARKIYGINMVASEGISLERSIPDTRMNECKYWNYPKDMKLKTSVVIAFYNEGYSTLLRNIHTILKRSPVELLEEIVLVDDFSNLENLKDKLEEHIKQFNGKVRLIRNAEREGLIRTRAIGAEQSRGDVVIFLDAHCEVNQNWLPPLLAPIYRDRTIMTVPFIDGIDHETFEYRPVYAPSSLYRGIFDWGLLYKEIEVPSKIMESKVHKSEPYKAPTHAGGLFAIDRKYFLELGGYDPGLLGWGAENFELSFKVWQCGGSIEWVPCSRIGHIYRGVPYGFGKLVDRTKGPIVKINYKRVIEVWFDDKYKEFFYARDPMARFLDHGDIRQQLAIKEKFKCKSFSWFMKNVAPDLLTRFPELPPNTHWGEMRNKGSNTCLDTLGRPAPAEIGLSGCHGQGHNQLIRLNKAGQLGVGERCIDIEKNIIKQIVCPSGSAGGPWVYNQGTGTMKHKTLKKCIAVHPTTTKLIIRDCETKNTYQSWIWKKVLWKH